MKRATNCLYLFLALLAFSCSSKPSEKEISKKVLMEYVCPDNAKVNELKIVKTEQTENLIGQPAYRYTVNGTVVWPDGCNEFGTGIQPGTSEKFEKTVTLSKGENGDWQ
jgi:hypothetical protein